MSNPNLNLSNLDARYSKPADVAQAISTQAATDAGQYAPIIGTQTRTVAQRARTRVSVKEWLSDTTGSSDQSANFQAAINSVAAAGDELYIDNDVIVRLDSLISVTTDSSVHVSGGGTIVVPTDSEAIRIAPATGAKTAISATTVTTDPWGYGTTVTRLTVASTTDIMRNDVIFVNSEDTYYDGTLKAELATVAYVDTANSYVYVGGILRDTYTTSPYVRRLSRQSVTWQGSIKFTYRSDPWAYTGTSPGRGVLIIEGVVAPIVQCTISSIPGYGLRIVSCFQPDVDVKLSGLRNDNSNQYLGYGVTAMCASRGGRYRVMGRYMRHAFTTNIYSRPGYDLWNYGAPREGTVTGEVYGATGNAFDTHATAYDFVFLDCRVVSESIEAGSGTGTWYSLQDRGCRTRIINFDHIGVNNPFYLAGQAQAYPEENVTLIENPRLVNPNTSVTPSAMVTVSKTGSGAARKIILIRGGVMEYMGFSLATGSAEIEFNGVRFHRFGLMRTNGSNTIRILNCSRFSTGADEGITLANGTTLYLDNYYHEGVTSSGTGIAMVYIGASGTAILNYGRLMTPTATLVRSANGGGTLTQTALTNLGV